MAVYVGHMAIKLHHSMIVVRFSDYQGQVSYIPFNDADKAYRYAAENNAHLTKHKRQGLYEVLCSRS